MIVEINFFSVFFDVESEYGIGLSLTITIFALEGWQSFFLTLYIFSDLVLRVNLEYKILGPKTPPSWGYAHFS
jgi:hypothetical protein